MGRTRPYSGLALGNVVNERARPGLMAFLSRRAPLLLRVRNTSSTAAPFRPSSRIGHLIPFRVLLFGLLPKS